MKSPEELIADNQRRRQKAGAASSTETDIPVAEKPWLPDDYYDEFGKVVGTGVTDLVNAFGSLPSDLGATDEPMWKMDPLSKRPQSIAGEVAAVVVQFAIPFTAGAKAVSLGARGASALAKVSHAPTVAAKFSRIGQGAALNDKIIKGTIAGAAADFAAFEPNDPNLSAMLKEHYELRGPFIDFMASDADDSRAVNRFRFALEGAGLGLLVAPALQGLGAGLKFSGSVGKKAVDAGLTAVPKPLKNIVNEKAASLKFKVDKATQNVADWGLGLTKLHNTAEDKGIQFITDAKKNVTLLDSQGLFNGRANFTERVLKRGPFERTSDDINGVQFKDIEGAKGLSEILDDVRKIGPNGLEEFENLMKYTQAAYLSRWRKKQNVSLLSKLEDDVQSKKHIPGLTKVEKKAMRDRIAQAKKSMTHGGIPDDEVQRELQRLYRLPEFRQLAGQLTELSTFNQNMLKMSKSFGIIDDATIKRYNDISPFHAYFFRVRPVESKVGKVFKDGSKQMKDSVHASRSVIKDEDLADALPLDDMIINLTKGTEQMTNQALANNLKTQAYATIEKLGDSGADFAVKQKPWQVKAAITSGKADELDFYWKDGKREYWRINNSGDGHFFLESIKAMGPTNYIGMDGVISNSLRGMKKFISNSITLDPTFAAYTNLIRDSFVASLLSKTGQLPIVGSAAGVVRNTFGVYSKGSTFKQLQRSGGGFGRNRYDPTTTAMEDSRTLGWFSKTPQQRLYKMGMIKKVNDTTIIQQVASNPGNVGSKAIEAAEKVASKFEMAARTTEFKRLIDEGYNELKAAAIVRDMTIDFGNHGSAGWIRTASSMIPFFNASIQGLERTARSMGGAVLKGEKLTASQALETKNLYKRLSTLAMGSVFLDLYHTQSESLLGDPNIAEIYGGIKEHVKEKNWVLIVPDYNEKTNTAEYNTFLMPKPFDHAIIPNVMVKAFKNMYSEEEQDFLGKYVLRVFGETTRFGDASLAPQGVRQIWEISTNKNFAGQDIEPEYMRSGPGKRSNQDMYYNWTSAGAHKLSKMLSSSDYGVEFSPMQSEYLIKSFLGTLGGVAYDLADDMVRGSSGLPSKMPRSYGADTPFLGWMARKAWIDPEGRGSTQYDVDIRERHDKAKEFMNSFIANQLGNNDFTSARYEELRNHPKFKDILVNYELLSKGLEVLSTLNSEINRIESLGDDAMTIDIKIKNIDSLNKQKKSLVKQFWKLSSGIVYTPKEEEEE